MAWVTSKNVGGDQTEKRVGERDVDIYQKKPMACESGLETASCRDLKDKWGARVQTAGPPELESMERGMER